jgi:ubiquinone/menaquinone biosynthesis C-methylase UbiE
MRADLQAQSSYWGKEADAFDRIYSHKKSGFQNVLDRWLRKDMYERFAFTLEHSEPVKERTFLDVGCGSGVYAMALAEKGAAHVTGLDIAENMLSLCREAAKRGSLEARCTFVHSDLLAFKTDSKFDVSIGIGLFDYIADSLPVLKKMREVTNDAVIVSFPRLVTWRAPIRKIRLALRGCAVYFYTRRNVARLLDEAGFVKHEIVRVGKLYCVIAHVK